MNEFEKMGWFAWLMIAGVGALVGFVLWLEHQGWIEAFNAIGVRYFLPVMVWSLVLFLGSVMLYAVVMWAIRKFRG